MLPVVLILLALLFWFLSRRAHQVAGLPAGRVVYTDTGGWGAVEKALFSSRLQLVGKPDYLVREGAGYVPVEVKSGRAPEGGPYAAHIYQLAAYCALVADTYGHRPAYGLIKYKEADTAFVVDFTRGLEAEVLDLLAQMRQEAEAEEVARSHSSPARCHACGYREVCEQSLT
jgi:CRISPR-associated exonuclease Cas4